MSEEKNAKEINDKIRSRRIKKGKIQCIFYGIVSIVMAVAAALISGKILLIPISLTVSMWLIFGAPFSKYLYVFGNIPYGIYILWLACVDMPTAARPGFPIVFMLILALYTVIGTVRISGSEAVSAYLYEKNAL